MCEVEVDDAEGDGRNEDCGPWVGSPAQHLAFDGFAEEQFFGDGTYDGDGEQPPDAVRHGECHLLHDVRHGDVLCEDGGAEGCEDASGDGERGRLPPDGGDVALCEEVYVVQEEVAEQDGDDVREDDAD